VQAGWKEHSAVKTLNVKAGLIAFREQRMLAKRSASGDELVTLDMACEYGTENRRTLVLRWNKTLLHITAHLGA
jgi:hypothetical protein